MNQKLNYVSFSAKPQKVMIEHAQKFSRRQFNISSNIYRKKSTFVNIYHTKAEPARFRQFGTSMSNSMVSRHFAP